MYLLFRKISLLVGCLIWYSLHLASAQEANLAPRPPFDSIQTLFQHLQAYDQILIETDLDSLVAKKFKNVSQSALVTFTGPDQLAVQFNISIKARGKFRRKTCEIPPVRLNFKKSELKEKKIFPDYDELKLATSCFEDADQNTNILKEFWVYKMYNELTEESFQVHPIEIKYVHATDTTRQLAARAFFIEPEQELAHRLGGESVNQMGVLLPTVDEDSYHRSILFNYMIGNTDWDIRMARNVKLIKIGEEQFFTLVPYDFDFSAIVDPDYFFIVPSRNPKLVRSNRVALGSFRNAMELNKWRMIFLEENSKGLSCYQSCPRLEPKYKLEMKEYLASFYKELKKEKRLKRIFIFDQKK